MCSVMKGVNGASALTRVNRTWQSVLSACRVSSTSSPAAPFSLFLLKRMYQLVRLSTS